MPAATRWGISVLAVTLAAWAAGCDRPAARLVEVAPRSGSLLLGAEPSALLATGIGRDPWPAAAGRLESTEETVYVESYYDFQGSAQNERITPFRNFRSWRVGVTQR
jgi:hypothetical protein